LSFVFGGDPGPPTHAVEIKSVVRIVRVDARMIHPLLRSGRMVVRFRPRDPSSMSNIAGLSQEATLPIALDHGSAEPTRGRSDKGPSEASHADDEQPGRGPYQIAISPREKIARHLGFMKDFAKRLSQRRARRRRGARRPEQAKLVRAGGDGRPIADGVFLESRPSRHSA
jgi:hypothetical protein